MNEQWNKVLMNEELARMIISFTPEEARKILLANGFDFSLDEIIETAKELNEIILMYSGDAIKEYGSDIVGGADIVLA